MLFTAQPKGRDPVKWKAFCIIDEDDDFFINKKKQFTQYSIYLDFEIYFVINAPQDRAAGGPHNNRSLRFLVVVLFMAILHCILGSFVYLSVVDYTGQVLVSIYPSHDQSDKLRNMQHVTDLEGSFPSSVWFLEVAESVYWNSWWSCKIVF